MNSSKNKIKIITVTTAIIIASLQPLNIENKNNFLSSIKLFFISDKEKEENKRIKQIASTTLAYNKNVVDLEDTSTIASITLISHQEAMIELYRSRINKKTQDLKNENKTDEEIKNFFINTNKKSFYGLKEDKTKEQKDIDNLKDLEKRLNKNKLNREEKNKERQKNKI